MNARGGRAYIVAGIDLSQPIKMPFHESNRTDADARANFLATRPNFFDQAAAEDLDEGRTIVWLAQEPVLTGTESDPHGDILRSYR